MPSWGMRPRVFLSPFTAFEVRDKGERGTENLGLCSLNVLDLVNASVVPVGERD